jgi:hypothetical protein
MAGRAADDFADVPAVTGAPHHNNTDGRTASGRSIFTPRARGVEALARIGGNKVMARIEPTPPGRTRIGAIYCKSANRKRREKAAKPHNKETFVIANGRRLGRSKNLSANESKRVYFERLNRLKCSSSRALSVSVGAP